jgi:glycosyltransferase involved in cell wall biosynthesis
LPFSRSRGSLRRWLYLALERVGARWTDRFIALSTYQLNALLEAALAEPDRVSVIPNGIVPSEFQGCEKPEARRALGLDASAPVALFAGRFRRQKGTDVLLEAAGLMGGKPPGFRLLILGEGPLQGRLKQQVRAGGLKDTVRLCGRTQRMDLYYAACDLVVMPSRAEGMPYVVLEAAAASRPVLACLVCGMEEFIQHGEDGFLVPPENPETLAEALTRLLSDRRGLARAGQSARARFRQEWRAPETVRRTCALYRRLASCSLQGPVQGGPGQQAG